MGNIKRVPLLVICLSLIIFIISCDNVNSLTKSKDSSISGSDVIQKSISNKISIVTGLNQFDPTDERFKIHYRNISTEPVIIVDISFSGANRDIYQTVNVTNGQCVVGDSIRPGGTCSVSIGAVSALSGLFTGDNLIVTFYSRFGGVGDFDIATPLESYILKSDSKLYMQSLVSGVSAYFYDFGRVPVGEYSLQTFKVFNSSGTTKGLHLESQDNSFFRIMPSILVNRLAIDTGLKPCSTSINDGEVCLIDILYFPSIEESSQTSILTVSSDPGGRGSVAPLQVMGTGAPQVGAREITFGDIKIDKSYLQFKKVVPVGSISDTMETFVMTNTSSTAITFSLKHINEAEYILSGSCISSRVLGANGSCELNVRFRPREVKQSNDIIIISSNDNSTAVPVLATASQPPPIEGLKYSYVISSRLSNPLGGSYIGIDNVSLVTFPDNPKVDELADKSVYIKVTNTKRDKIFFTENISSDSIFLSGTNPGRCASSVAGSSSCVIRLDVIPAVHGETFNTFSLHSGTGSFVFPLILKAEPDNITTGSFTVNKSSLEFYDTEVGFTSSAKINVRNEGGVANPINITIPDNSSVFRISTTCLLSGVAGDSSCDVNILFTPTKVDNYTSEVEIGGVKIPVKGKGVNQFTTDTETPITGLSIDKKKYSFEPTEIDAVSKSAKFTLTANNNVKVKFTVPSYFRYEKDFSTCSIATDNTLSLSTGSSCVVAYSFAPTSEGSVNDTVLIADTLDETKSTKITLLGEVLSRNKVAIHGYTTVGTAKAETMAYYNSEKFPLKIEAVSLTGYSVGDDGSQTQLFDSTFRVIFDGCSDTVLEPMKACNIDISFNPLANGKYIGKVDIPITGKPTKRMITVGSTVNHEFVPIIPESSYQVLGRPEQSMIAFNNRVYAIGGNHATHEESNALKILDMQSMEWSKVKIDNTTEEFAPYASYKAPVALPEPIVLQPIVPINSVSIRGVKFDIYDGELAVVGGYLSETPDITTTSTNPAYEHAKTNYISFIDLKTGKWRSPRRMHELYAHSSVYGGPGNNIGTEIDRRWGDVSRLGTSYYHTGGKPFPRGNSTLQGNARLLYYDFGQDNKSFSYSITNIDYYRGMGVSTLSTGGALFLHQYLLNSSTNPPVASFILGNNYQQGSNNLGFFVSRVNCASSPNWQGFNNSNVVARLLSGSFPEGNRFSTAYFRSKSTKVHNMFLGPAYNNQSVYRVAITETTDGNPCTNYTATVKGYNKKQVGAPSSVFVYDDRLWVISNNLIQVLITTDF